MVLLGGDLYHENKPSRSTEKKCISILRKYVLGDRPINLHLVSDPNVNFSHCDETDRNVNYANPNMVCKTIFAQHHHKEIMCKYWFFYNTFYSTHIYDKTLITFNLSLILLSVGNYSMLQWHSGTLTFGWSPFELQILLVSSGLKQANKHDQIRRYNHLF